MRETTFSIFFKIFLYFKLNVYDFFNLRSFSFLEHPPRPFSLLQPSSTLQKVFNQYRKEIICYIRFFRLTLRDDLQEQTIFLLYGLIRQARYKFYFLAYDSNEKYTNISIREKIPLIFYISGI